MSAPTPDQPSSRTRDNPGKAEPVKVLVSGGAGYIGAHVVRRLAERGDQPIIVDDLSAGDANRVAGFPLITLDLSIHSSAKELTRILREHRVDAVIHFAALKAAGESVHQPVRYYQQNIGTLTTVLDAMTTSGTKNLVFSSSAAVYGDTAPPLDEDAPTHPISPYGETKLIGEWLVGSAARAHALNAISLRYFNVAGAGAADLGDTSVNNLIPMTIERLAANTAPRIFGNDYDTPDGTCLRDYIHVVDLADAHLAALDNLREGHRVYNVGTGSGTSVRDIIDLVLTASGSTLTPDIVERRPGDPDVVVANVDRIRAELGWEATLTARDAVESAWQAHLSQNARAQH